MKTDAVVPVFPPRYTPRQKGTERSHAQNPTIRRRNGTFSFMYFARSMIAMPDGRLLATVYGVWEGDVARRSVVVQSTDEGKTWT